MWSLRCVHEAKFHKQNCFVTLTYDQDNHPEDGSISVVHFQNFMKELRASIAPKKVRFFGCGEYGEKVDPNYETKLGRPHYHILIFGHDFDDSVLFHQGDYNIYTSEKLQALWRKGHSTIGALTQETAAYTARYCTKKITGELAEEHYKRTNKQTGETNQLRPEFLLMSRRPGIAKKWFEKYKADTQKGFVTNDGKTFGIPKYYQKLMTELEEETLIQNRRAFIPKEKARLEEKSRQYTVEKVKKLKHKQLKRTI